MKRTVDFVEQVRRKRARGALLVDLADEYKCSVDTIRRAVNDGIPPALKKIQEKIAQGG